MRGEPAGLFSLRAPAGLNQGIGVAVVLGLAMLAAIPTAAAQQGAVGLGDQAEELRAMSQVEALNFTLLDKLPKAPAAAKSKAQCDGFLVKPRSTGGRLVASRGWGVTGEAALGDDEAVSFAGSFTWDPGDICTIEQGNVAIFHGGKLLAIAYGRHTTDTAIGRIEPLDSGAVRVWSGDPVSAPMGDIKLLDGGYLLQLGAVAAEDSVCGGKGVVPNIFGLSIDKARAKLLASGWQPAPQTAAPDPATFPRETELIGKGVTEVDSCAGTGLANCAFDYAGPAGKLVVDTIGEDEYPGVNDYDVQCK